MNFHIFFSKRRKTNIMSSKHNEYVCQYNTWIVLKAKEKSKNVILKMVHCASDPSFHFGMLIRLYEPST